MDNVNEMSVVQQDKTVAKLVITHKVLTTAGIPIIVIN